ncbi:pyridoxal-phosphate dependent enzyme [Amycolatopsis sp. A1MSW2902]|uniref:pyridoxal-phosphate dependent enzyme n=1 Tax=Amycolatopsis sp. A1MSW2902 TaxID=687413 RepID=UPI00307DEEDB
MGRRFSTSRAGGMGWPALSAMPRPVGSRPIAVPTSPRRTATRATPTAGYRALALELHDDLGENIQYLYGAVGTGGSLCGTGRVLRERIPDLRIIGVEPVGSVNFGGDEAHYHQSGTGTPEVGEICDTLDYSLIDEGIKAGDAEAFETCRYLVRNFGILIGGSAGNRRSGNAVAAGWCPTGVCTRRAWTPCRGWRRSRSSTPAAGAAVR